MARVTRRATKAGPARAQIIRIVRLVRFVSLLNRLYATAMAASAIVLPGVTVSHNHAHFFNLLFGGAMLLNFLSCLWCPPPRSRSTTMLHPCSSQSCLKAAREVARGLWRDHALARIAGVACLAAGCCMRCLQCWR